MNEHIKPAGLTVQQEAIPAGRNPAGGEPQRARPAARSDFNKKGNYILDSLTARAGGFYRCKKADAAAGA